MALFDKLKGFAEKAKETAKDVASAAKSMADSAKWEISNSPAATAPSAEAAAPKAAEPQFRLQELLDEVVDAYINYSFGEFEGLRDAYLEVADDEEGLVLFERLAELETKKCEQRIAELSQNSDCELGQGRCAWLGCSFYCTCGDSVDCPRKKYLSENEKCQLISAEHLPYIKLIGDYYQDGDLKTVDGKTGLPFGTAFSYFFEKFLPEHLPSTRGDFSMAFASFLLAHGMGTENIVMEILFSIHDQTGGKVVPPVDYLIGIYYDILNSDDENDYLNIALPFFKNPSLYDRSREDLEYTAAILDTVYTPSKRAAAFPASANVCPEMLFNEDGTIKEAGIGGPRNGFYGDVIYNIVQSWKSKEE